MKKSVLHKIIFILPIFYVFWGTFVFSFGGPVYLSRIDPEFIHLLNGLNCAILEFDRIGHVDLPGTPFQILTGLFIRVIHLFAGKGPIVEDVFRNPELYFFWSAFFLTFLTAVIIFYLGKIVLKYTNDLFGVIILQSSIFFSLPLIDAPYRYFPDRLLILIMLVFIGLCIKLFYGNLTERKFTIWSGFLMGMGVVTKFVFLPFLILPFLIIKNWKERIKYIIALTVFTVLFFLPVINKFNYFKDFITGLIIREGQYGGGEKQILNTDKFFQNLETIILHHFVFFIFLISSLFLILTFILKPEIRKRFKNEFSFLVAINITAIMNIIMVGKHYKDYYLDSLLITGGFIFFILWRIRKTLYPNIYLKYIFYFSFILILFFATKTLYPGYKFRRSCYTINKMNSLAINKLVSNNDYLFMEPSWESGPFVTNGFAFGLSYVKNRAYYYNDFEKIYPFLLTYEGPDKPMKYARMIDADNEAILKSGKSISIYSSPGRNTPFLIQYLIKEASLHEIALLVDTVFTSSNNEEYLIRLRQNSWITKSENYTGFENIVNGTIFTRDGKSSLTGNFIIDNNEVCNGNNSIKLGTKESKSPVLKLHNVAKGDYIELTIKRRINKFNNKGSLVIHFQNENQETINESKGAMLSYVSSNWEIIRLSTTINSPPINNSIECFYQYSGDKEVFIDDFTIKHFVLKENP